MLFNSIEFAVFFIIIFTLYILLRNKHRLQNRMLLLASCIFYGMWDWRFLFLIFISITTDYICSLRIHASNNEFIRKRWLLLSIIINLSILGLFKYFNFFISNMQLLLNEFGLWTDFNFIHIILPVAISFYTFQTMSYTIDIYRREIIPVNNFFDYSLFITFFPHLLAGPILRARDLLNQIISPRVISLEKFYQGCYLIFWGLFQKIFIADNLTKIVDPVFSTSPPYNGVNVALALYAFTFQIYCDFAGYSNIAKGLYKCMGFDILYNFNLPYFSTSPKEFWQRWHISLSSWLRDYLYIQLLGGNRKGKTGTNRNIALTMIVCGIWHGANWTFIIWGAYHGFIQVLYRIFDPIFKKISPFNTNTNRRKKIWLVFKVLFMFHLACLGWLFFRAGSLTQAFEMLKSMIINFQIDPVFNNGIVFTKIFLYIWLLLIIEIIQYRKNDLLAIYKLPFWIKSIVYFIMLVLLLVTGASGGKEFIYFQF